MTNSRSIQRLEDDGRRRWPGITIYDVGDLPHAQGVSGHNPDDTVLPQGGRAEDTDADSLPEVRALDFMIRGPFMPADAAYLFEALTRRPANQARLLYVIYNRRIRSRSDGWRDRAYTGSNPHTDHVHASGRAEDDDNASPWDIDIEEEPEVLTENQDKRLTATNTRIEKTVQMADDTPINWGTTAGAVEPNLFVRAVKQIAEDAAAARAEAAAARAAVAEVPQAVVAAIGGQEDDAAVAAALRAVLGDRAAAVGALLAADAPA